MKLGAWGLGLFKGASLGPYRDAFPPPKSGSGPGVATAPLGSGPWIARLFHRLLAVILLFAWVSLALQIELLAGSRGLLPARDAVLPPSLFSLIPPTDAVLVGGAWLGAALAVAAFAGLVPRVLAFVQLALYFSYTVAARDFLTFQWDNLLLETCLLAIFLPRDRPSPLIHFAFRFLLFKLYFESGVAKWQSHLGDWQDGSAMTYYYETAPIPTFLARFAHELPDWWHHLESRATLFVEIVVPFAFFAPRVFRLAAFVVLTGFQVVNAATANYGFFVYLALVLHVFLLDDRKPALGAPPRRGPLVALLVVYVTLSALEFVVNFADRTRTVARAAQPVRRIYAPYRLVNTYRLFGHITRERIEPEFQTSADGKTWRSHHFKWKPGPTDRAPPIVAPHQPRVDFLLWFYGLEHERGMPRYVSALLERLCRDPVAVESLFTEPLPREPAAVRILFFDYRFSPLAAEWWTATPAGGTRAMPCPKSPGR